MSAGGKLVVLDRAGRAVKHFPLPSGLVTLGRHPDCDICIIQQTVSQHHATVVVHANQTVVRNVADGQTLVNGHPVSVSALQHNDIITIGGRQLRWEYDEPNIQRPLPSQPALYVRERSRRNNRRATGAPPAAPSVNLHLRASMPGNAGGKQVAIVQPQRRDTSEQNASTSRIEGSPRQPQNKRSRVDTQSPLNTSNGRKSTPRISPKTLALQNPTKASLWIDARKTSPRKSAKIQTPVVNTARKVMSAKKSTPLRLAVLRKAQSVQKAKITKIQAPTKIDHTKQAAIMLMTGHTKSKLPMPKQPATKPPTLVIKRPSPVKKSPKRASSAKKSPKSASSAPKRATRTPNVSGISKLSVSGISISTPMNSTRRSSKRGTAGQSLSVVEISASDSRNSTLKNNTTRQSKTSPLGSPLLPSPKKSALKDPNARKSTRKNESIKFDLSNLDNFHDDDVIMVADSTKGRSITGVAEDDLSLHYSDSSTSSVPRTPSPRRPIHSRSSQMLEQVGSPITKSFDSQRTLTPDSAKSKKSLRGSMLVQKALETSGSANNTTVYSRRSSKTLSDESFDSTAESAFRTRDFSTRASKQNMESYSIVDLVSADSIHSNQSSSSVYGSVGSTRSSSIVFGTPQTGRKTRSTIDSNLLTSSTPYVGKGRVSKRSRSSPNISQKTSPNKSKASISRRSKSLTNITPENSQPHIHISSTKLSRTSKSRSRMNESDVQFLSSRFEDEDSPRSSRRTSKIDASQASPLTSPRKSQTSVLNISSPRQSRGSALNKTSPRGSKGSPTKTASPKASPRKSQSTILNTSSPRQSRGSVLNKTTPRGSQGSPTKTASPMASPRKSQSSVPNKSRLSNIASPRESQGSPSVLAVLNKSSPRLSRSYVSNLASPRGSEGSPSIIASPRKTQSTILNKSSPRQSRGSVSNTASRKSSLGSPSIITSPRYKTSPRKSSTVLNKSSPRLSQGSMLNKTSPRASQGSPKASPRTSQANALNKSSPRNAQATSPNKSRLRKSQSSPLLKSSSRQSQRSASRQSGQTRKSSRSNLSVNTTLANSHEEGTVTPENRNSLEEIGTPVLSIQSLLDSSQSSLASFSNAANLSQKRKVTLNFKRKTIGASHSGRKGRSSIKSKSLNLTNRASLRSSRGKNVSVDSLAGSDKEENVTPKSAIKLVQEPVKNKHSTAKKPQSKRSLIDNLNESDFIKQLFNSPVKRKLSQSMTEFSRRHLDEDDEVAPKRQKRNTVALTGRTLNDSILDNSDQFTPENFVSPLSTPGSTPNLDGVKRLFKKNTPQNDLRNIHGVKKLLKTPQTRKSVKNDLRNVSGVKATFGRSPRNRLSDVRVKELFAEGPRNDLKRVSGVKLLFQGQAVARNDLSDVRGVREIYKQKSPKNDLRNVSGVKRILQSRSPKNDLTDVRGVRRLFRQQKQKEDEINVSGVEELFNVSVSSHKDSEQLFDEMIGRPPIKAVYSKSLIAKSQKKPKARKVQSLRKSIEAITNNVEEWIEQELQKHVHKVSNKSINKSNVTKELQKLATDTVGGTTPLVTSRLRTSGVNVEGKKSVADNYSAHKLPIKKRSLVEATLEKSKTEVKKQLPIKKRAVVHSTPVKGKYNLTMNASELGRVSPIAAVDKTGQVDTDVTVRMTSQQSKQSPKAKGRANKSAQRTQLIEIEVPPIIPVPKSPPRGRRATKANEKTNKSTKIASPKLASPKPKRGARSNKPEQVEVQVKSPAKRGKAAKNVEKVIEVEVPPVKRNTRNKPVASKSPKASPKPKRGAKAKVVEKEKSVVVKSPPKTRETRRKAPQIEKVTNTKKRRSSLVITKKPPVLSPKPDKPVAKTTRRGKVIPESPKVSKAMPKASPKATRGKPKVQSPKAATPKIQSPKAKTSKGTKSKPKEASVQASPKKAIQTRRQKAEAPKPSTPKSTRAKVTKTTVVVAKPSPILKPRGAKGKKVENVPVKATRGKASVTAKDNTPKKVNTPKAKGAKSKKQSIETPKEVSIVKGRKTRNVKSEAPIEAPKRGRRGAASIQPEPKTSNTDVAQTKGRKRKLEPIASPKVEAKTSRGRKATEEKVQPPKGNKKDDKTKKAEPAKVTSARGKGKAAKTPTIEAKPTRGRKTTAAAEVPQAGGRKRKQNASPSPANVPVKRSRVAAISPAKGAATKRKNNATAVSAARSTRRR